MDVYLTLNEVCELLKISIRHLQNIRKCATFPRPIYIGKSKVRFNRSDLNLWLLQGGMGGGQNV